MAKIQETQPLVASIIDRLKDNEPDVTWEQPKSSQQVLREMKQAVQRDLGQLLNTRWKATSPPQDLKELTSSLISYGIPDFAAAGMGGYDDRELLRAIIERVIRTHETRFKTVKVVLDRSPDPADRRLHLRIEALLYAEPAPEPIIFDSHLEPASGNFTIRQSE